MTILYNNEKFTTWTLNHIAEVLYEEWSDMHPTLAKDAEVYGRNVTNISFEDEVSVSLALSRQPYPQPGHLDLGIGMSLSPKSWDAKTHVLNTFDIADFLGLFPQLGNEKFLSIPKTCPWGDSYFPEVARASRSLLKVLLKFDACFELLTNNTYSISGDILNTKKLDLTYHLNCIKAYHLAKVYNHPERFDEAIKAIRDSASVSEFATKRLKEFCATHDPGGLEWLYSLEMIERLNA